jgi:hypothetical protein
MLEEREQTADERGIEPARGGGDSEQPAHVYVAATPRRP